MVKDGTKAAVTQCKAAQFNSSERKREGLKHEELRYDSSGSAVLYIASAEV